MKPYAELLEYTQPSLSIKEGHGRIRDTFPITFHVLGPERIIEFAGRWDYGEANAAKLGQESKRGGSIIRRWIDQGHESMLEMAWATFFVECSRVVSHELVRHRHLSFQQESQRFTRYDEENANAFYWPDELDGDLDSLSMYSALDDYKALRERGIAPQLARYVLPNAMRTRLVVGGNLRSWRHVLKLRMDKSAQPEMQELMKQIYDQLQPLFPNVLYWPDDSRGIR